MIRGQCPVGKNLTTLDSGYRQDWSVVLSEDASKSRQRIKPAAVDGMRYATELLRRVDSLINNTRNAWTWSDNSCHLDCWLMVELSSFEAVARVTGLLTDDMIQSSPALTKLFKVLLSAGTPDQDVLKMSYWVMEIESYRSGSAIARKQFKCSVEYHSHAALFASALRYEHGPDLSNIHVGYEPTCNNPDHQGLDKMTRKQDYVRVDEHWYSMPDDWTRTKDADGRWHTDTCTYKLHKSLGDVLESLIGRTDGETTECVSCFKSQKLRSYQITHKKDPGGSRLPLFLLFQTDPGHKVVANETIKVGDAHYSLKAVVFGNGTHYKCNVVLNRKWFNYDGMGMRSKKQHLSLDFPRVPRLARISAPDTFMTPPERTKDYNAIAYKYVRTAPGVMGPMDIANIDSIASDTQFNNMSRLYRDE